MPFDILQEQLKFIYDTLEEFIVCGYTYFPVKDLSHHLKQKSVRKPGRKNNEYEREYAVRKFIIKTSKQYLHDSLEKVCLLYIFFQKQGYIVFFLPFFILFIIRIFLYILCLTSY